MPPKDAMVVLCPMLAPSWHQIRYGWRMKGKPVSMPRPWDCSQTGRVHEWAEGGRGPSPAKSKGFTPSSWLGAWLLKIKKELHIQNPFFWFGLVFWSSKSRSVAFLILLFYSFWPRPFWYTLKMCCTCSPFTHLPIFVAKLSKIPKAIGRPCGWMNDFVQVFLHICCTLWLVGPKVRKVLYFIFCT